MVAVTPVLELRNLDFMYQHKPILRDVCFSLAEGEVMAVVGPSGAGKSTLLKAIALLAMPSSGEILYQGNVVFAPRAIISKSLSAEYKRAVGLVFQQLHLWPHLTVLQNVTLPLTRGKGLDEQEARAKSIAMLDRLAMSDLANQFPSRLSVGQQQRCAIARTLAIDPTILLLDEITSALDPELVSSIQSLIKDIASESGRSLLVVTHQIDFAQAISHRILYLRDGTVAAFETQIDMQASADNGQPKPFVDSLQASIARRLS
jgi:polar amino acid transport system ATP-binding protein